MNAPTTMLSTPAAVGFQVLIRSSSAPRPSESSCQGTNRLIRADESKTASRVAGIDLDVIMVAATAIARAGLTARVPGALICAVLRWPRWPSPLCASR